MNELLFGCLIAVVAWIGRGMAASLRHISTDVSSMKVVMAEHFTELKNHKERTDEKFTDAHARFNKIEGKLNL